MPAIVPLVVVMVPSVRPMHANGMGSIIAIHFSGEPTKTPADISAGCRALRPLLHMELLLDGISICGRGDFFLSLPMHETHLAKARASLERFIDRHKPLIADVLQHLNDGVGDH